jgi:predicted short-subunit dehydrogenase-like oxidoreductase (DUF2520 family)
VSTAHARERAPMSSRRAAIVGPGRLGTLVAHALTAAGTSVVRVAGGSAASRSQLRSGLAGVRDVPVEEVAQGVGLVVIATPDAAIETVVDRLVRADALDESHGVVHLAGVHGTAPLRRAGLAGARIAALHPATTVPTGATDPSLLHGVAWAVTTGSGDRAWAHELVQDLGGDPFDVPDEARVRYHAGLALASNAVGAAVVAARHLLRSAGIADAGRLIAPIAHASIETAAAGGAAALTGPVVRGDEATVRAHLAAIAPDLPEVAAAYRALSRAVLLAVRPALDPAVATALAALLGDPATDLQSDPETQRPGGAP